MDSDPDRTSLGVLLVNIGSPEAPTPRAVRRFLAEFLSDPRVVDANPLLWWFIRTFVVLPFRGRSSARLYRSVWTPEGSPLLSITKRQRDGLAQALGHDVPVTLGMRYGEPSMARGLEELRAAGCSRVVLFSMFPQFSRSTSGSVEEELARQCSALPDPPQILRVAPYYEDEVYLQSVAARMRTALAAEPVEHVVLSFHGLPVRYVENGDPYRDHCEKTAAGVVRLLDLEEGSWSLAYQSRFGREPWLEPNVAELVPELASTKRRVLVACPGFTADCLETLEEIGIRLKSAFHDAGGEELVIVPCLNDHETWVSAMADLVRRASVSPTAPMP